MPQWAGSSWYFLRYMDPHNDKELASKQALSYWSPVDWYNGGMEHTTFTFCTHVSGTNSFLISGSYPPRSHTRSVPAHGMILGENGEKMSKAAAMS